MAKRTETKLVVSAQDLSTKTLKDIARTFRQIRDAQRETQGVSDRTKVSFRELETTVRQLETVLDQLNTRKAGIKALAETGVSAKAAKDRVAALEQELKDLAANTDAAGQKTDKFKQRQSELNRQLRDAKRNVDRLEQSYLKQSNAIEALGLNSIKAQQDLNRLLATTQRAATEARGDVDALAREQREYKEALTQTRAEEERLRSARRKSAQERLVAERSVQSGFASFSRGVDQGAADRRAAAAVQRRWEAEDRALGIQQRAAVVEQQLNQRRQQSATLLTRLSAALRNTSAATGQLARTTTQAATSQDRANRSTLTGVEAQRTALSLSQRIRGQMLSIAASYVGIFGAVATGQRAIQVYNERLALNTRLLVANDNNAKAAAQDYQFLRDEADRLGFSLTDLGTGYSKLAIAGKAAGFSVEETKQVFSSFSEVARVFNLNTEESGRVFRALEQVMSKGKVQAEELRGQLGDVLPGAYTAFARALQNAGVIESMTDLDKLMEQGKVSARALIAFSQQYAQMVQGQLGPASKNLTAQLGRLRTAWDDFLVTVANDALAGAVRDVADEVSRFLKSSEGADAAKALGDLIRILGQVAIGAAKNLGMLVTLAKAFVAVGVGKVLYQVGMGMVALVTRAGPAVGLLRGLATGTVAWSAAMRGLLVTLGPIGLALAGISLAWGIMSSRGDAAAQAAERQRKALNDLTDKADEAATSIAQLNTAQDDLTFASTALEKAIKAEEKAKAELARTGAKTAQQAYDNAKAKREEAERTQQNAAKVVQEAEAKRKRSIQEAREAIASHRAALQEVIDKKNIAKAALAEAQARLANAKARMAESVGGRAQEAFARQAGRADADVRGAQGALGEITKELNAYEATFKEIEKTLLSATKPIALDPSEILLGGDDKEKDPKKKVDETLRLLEDAMRFLADVRRDGLQQQTEDEETALAARLELIRMEYAERLKQADELAAKLRAAGKGREADDVAASKAQIAAQQQVAEQRARLEASSAATRKAMEAHEERINRIVEERQRLLDDVERRKNIGAITEQEAVRETERIEKKRFVDLKAATADYIRFLMAAKEGGNLSPVDLKAIDEAIFKMQGLADSYTPISEKQKIINDLNGQMAQGITDGIAAGAQGIAGWIKGMNSFTDAIKGAWDVFRTFIADFLIQIGKAILQQIILNALQNAAKNAGGGWGAFVSAAAGAMSGGSKHTGGIVGHEAKNRNLSPLMFAAAQRYHTGGVVGLAPNEVPIVAKRGEEVLTESDPRHRNNGGMGGQNIKIINAIDSASVVQEGMNSPAGTRAILNVVRANKAAFRAAMA